MASPRGPRRSILRATPPASRAARAFPSSTSTRKIPTPSCAIGRLAAEYRAEFNSDVVVDLVGYRRHGPQRSGRSHDHPAASLRTHQEPPRHSGKFMPNTPASRRSRSRIPLRKEVRRRTATGREADEKFPTLRKLPDYWTPFNFGKYDPKYEVDTGLSPETLAKITDGLVRAPAGFHVHAKIVSFWSNAPKWAAANAPLITGFAETARLRFAGFGRQIPSASRARIHSAALSTSATRFWWWTHRPNRNTCRSLTSHPIRVFAKSTILRFPKPAALGYEYGFLARLSRSAGCYGKRNSGFRERRAVIIDQFLSASEGQMGAPQWLGVAASARL